MGDLWARQEQPRAEFFRTEHGAVDPDALRSDLEAATLTAEEMDANWDAFEDRFPRFEDDPEAEQTDNEPAEDTDSAEEVGLAD